MFYLKYTKLFTTISFALSMIYSTNVTAEEIEVATNKDSKLVATETSNNQNLGTLSPNNKPAILDNKKIDYSPFTKEEFLKEVALCEQLFTKKDKLAYQTCNNIASTKAAGPKLQYIMAHIFFEGLGVAQNNDRGINWLYKAYNNGNIDAKKDLGIFSLNIFLNNNNLGTGRSGINMLQDAAKSGNIEASYYLADIKKRAEFKELGVYNPQVAYQEMKKIADNNSYLPAILSLAEMTLQGVGTKADAKTAYELLNKAANLGSTEAYKQLSLLEEANDKFENNYLSYFHQLKHTQCVNSSDNMIRLEKLEAKLSAEELKKAKAQAPLAKKICAKP